MLHAVLRPRNLSFAAFCLIFLQALICLHVQICFLYMKHEQCTASYQVLYRLSFLRKKALGMLKLPAWS